MKPSNALNKLRSIAASCENLEQLSVFIDWYYRKLRRQLSITDFFLVGVMVQVKLKAFQDAYIKETCDRDELIIPKQSVSNFI